MNKLLCIICVLTLTACASSSAPDFVKADNSDIAQLNNCADIKSALETAKLQLAQLNKAKNLQNSGNALAVGAALLSLNPTILFDIKRTDKLNASIQSYEERIQSLQNKLQTSCEEE